MKFMKITPAIFGLIFLTACVTINIYFPSAQAQEAAEMIVDDILGKGMEKPAASEGDKSSSLTPVLYNIAEATLNFLIPAAHAAPNFAVDTPQIRQLQASMKKRHGSLKAYYQSGAIGFANNASVAVRDSGLVPLKQRAKLKKLVAAENNERSQMYKAIAAANGHPEWEAEVRSVFASTWTGRAAAGWWYQQADGQWVQK